MDEIFIATRFIPEISCDHMSLRAHLARSFRSLWRKNVIVPFEWLCREDAFINGVKSGLHVIEVWSDEHISGHLFTASVSNVRVKNFFVLKSRSRFLVSPWSLEPMEKSRTVYKCIHFRNPFLWRVEINGFHHLFIAQAIQWEVGLSFPLCQIEHVERVLAPHLFI